MPFFSEKPASSGQVHEFLLPGGLDGLRACEEQSSIPEKVTHEDGLCQAAFSSQALHLLQSAWSC